MEISRAQRPLGKPSVTSCNLTDVLKGLLSGDLSNPVLHLAFFDPGSGKTSSVCSFLQSWKASGFKPDNGALIVLATHKEILSCIQASGLDPADYGVLIAKDKALPEMGNPDIDGTPVLFTTQEKLRHLCSGRSFAEVALLHYAGRPRQLRVWDEAFLPSVPTILRKDSLLQPLEKLRPLAPETASLVDALGDSLSADRAGELVQVPAEAAIAQGVLKSTLGAHEAERWAPLKDLAGTAALIVNDGGNGVSLVGAGRSIPADFAPALILDASGRVRETYKALEAQGIIQPLPVEPKSYSRLTVHHWHRAASRSTLKDEGARAEVLEAARAVIDAHPEEDWLVIHPKGRDEDNIFRELSTKATRPDRLSSVHWGAHHGTNDFRHIRKVMVLGLWHRPRPYYQALQIAAGVPLSDIADCEALDTFIAGEHRHDLLQGVCRASVRQWGTDGTCGACEVYLIGRLGSGVESGRELLLETFPGAEICSWVPEVARKLSPSHRLQRLLETAFEVPGVVKVQKATMKTAMGYGSSQALSKVIRQGDMRVWMDRRGIEVTARAFLLQGD